MAPGAATEERKTFTAETRRDAQRARSEFLEAHLSVCSSPPW